MIPTISPSLSTFNNDQRWIQRAVVWVLHINFPALPDAGKPVSALQKAKYTQPIAIAENLISTDFDKDGEARLFLRAGVKCTNLPRKVFVTHAKASHHSTCTPRDSRLFNCEEDA